MFLVNKYYKDFEAFDNDNSSFTTLTYGSSERVILIIMLWEVAKAALRSSVRYLAVRYK